jgi:thiamine pyrophosphokinase
MFFRNSKSQILFNNLKYTLIFIKIQTISKMSSNEISKENCDLELRKKHLYLYTNT